MTHATVRKLFLALSVVFALSLNVGSALAAAPWLDPVGLPEGSDQTAERFRPVVAVAPSDGKVARDRLTAIWQHKVGDGKVELESSYRDPGSSQKWSKPWVLSKPWKYIVDLQVATDGKGLVTAVWLASQGGGNWELYVAQQDVADGWYEPVMLADTGDTYMPTDSKLAVNKSGSAAVLWRLLNTQQADSSVQAVTHDSSNKFSEDTPVEKISGNTAAWNPDVVVDSKGNFRAIWEAPDGIYSGSKTTSTGVWGFTNQVGLGGSEPKIATDSNGNSVAIWYKKVGDEYVVMGSRRPYLGAWTAAQPISSHKFKPSKLRLASDAAGNAFAALYRFDQADPNNQNFLEVSTSSSGSSAWKTASVTTPGVTTVAGISTVGPSLAVNSAGDASAVWTDRVSGTSTSRLRAVRYMKDGGYWKLVSKNATTSVDKPISYDSVVDQEGNVIALWDNFWDGFGHVQVSVLDTTPPKIDSFTYPKKAKVGELLTFTAKASDSWSSVTTKWSFDMMKIAGDSPPKVGAAQGDGQQVTFSKPGTYTVRVSAIDAAYNPADEYMQVEVEPADDTVDPGVDGPGGSEGGGSGVIHDNPAAPSDTVVSGVTPGSNVVPGSSASSTSSNSACKKTVDRKKLRKLQRKLRSLKRKLKRATVGARKRSYKRQIKKTKRQITKAKKRKVCLKSTAKKSSKKKVKK